MDGKGSQMGKASKTSGLSKLGKRRIALTACALVCCCAIVAVVFGLVPMQLGLHEAGYSLQAGQRLEGEDVGVDETAQGAVGEVGGSQESDLPKLGEGSNTWSPSNFGSQEEADYYEGNWHTDGDLRSKYSFKEVTTSSGSQYAAGELNVTTSSELTDDEVRAMAEGLGGTAIDIYRSAVMNDLAATFIFPDDTDMDEMAERAAALPGVMYASPNYSCRALESPEALGGTIADPRKVGQSYLVSSRFEDAWKVSKCLGSVTVAVLDSGVDFDHEDLLANVDSNRAWDAFTQGALDFDTPDFCGHGTAVSGVIAAEAFNGKGIAGASYDAKILPVRTLDVTGATTTNVISQAFDYLFSLDETPRVVNMSLGGKENDPRLEARVKRAISEFDMVLIASVGNDSASGHTDDPLRYPAAYEGVIGVGAVGADGKDNSRCEFSNVNDSVDICAVGLGVLTTVDPQSVYGSLDGERRNYAYSYSGMTSGGVQRLLIAGTSFAAPQVSAAAALVLAKDSSMGGDQVAQKLFSTAKDLGATGRDRSYGYGLLDAACALGADRRPSSQSGSASSSESFIPTGPVATGQYITGAATRDASPIPEMLGLASVEESG